MHWLSCIGWTQKDGSKYFKGVQSLCQQGLPLKEPTIKGNITLGRKISGSSLASAMQDSMRNHLMKTQGWVQSSDRLMQACMLSLQTAVNNALVLDFTCAHVNEEFRVADCM